MSERERERECVCVCVCVEGGIVERKGAVLLAAGWGEGPNGEGAGS